MSRLLETIKIQDGKICNIAYHSDRLNRSRVELFHAKDRIDLEDHILIDDFHKKGMYKCRVLYKDDIERIELYKYERKTIQKIRLVYDDTIDYKLKYEDRSTLDNLYKQRGDADDILIIKNGFITDSYYCNVAFKTKSGEWFTPMSPLLKGTKRQRLIDNGSIDPKPITVADLGLYESVSLFNSLIELGEIELSINVINI